MKPGDDLETAGFDVELDGVAAAAGHQLRRGRGRSLRRLPRRRQVADVLTPSKRIYTDPQHADDRGRDRDLTRASQLYVSPGEISADGSVTVRIWWKPLVVLIWLGAALMVVGGAVSLSDRRLRVGAPRQARGAGPARARPNSRKWPVCALCLPPFVMLA